MAETVDIDLVLSRFNSGDEEAFRSIFQRFYQSSCSFVNNYVNNSAAAKDIVQNTFINLWNKRGIYSDIVYFKAYLYKSLRNNAVQYLQRQKPQTELDRSLRNDSDDVLHNIVVEEVHREIIQAIERLPQQRRRIVEMTLAGLSQDEIADQMNISTNTVKTQKRKAYAFMRSELKDLFAVFIAITFGM